MNLNHARLPIPPFPRGTYVYYADIPLNSFLFFKKIFKKVFSQGKYGIIVPAFLFGKCRRAAAL